MAAKLMGVRELHAPRLTVLENIAVRKVSAAVHTRIQ